MVTLNYVDITQEEKYYCYLFEAFPPEEIPQREDWLARFNDDKFKIISIMLDGDVVGLFTVWLFEGLCFIEHFMIFENVRNGGIGSKALQRLKEVFPKIVLEAELDNTPIQKRRLDFYRRNGFEICSFEYYMPPYRSSDAPIKMFVLSDFQVGEEIVRSIYKNVYKIDKE